MRDDKDSYFGNLGQILLQNFAQKETIGKGRNTITENIRSESKMAEMI